MRVSSKLVIMFVVHQKAKMGEEINADEGMRDILLNGSTSPWVLTAFQFHNLFKIGRTPWTSDWLVAMPLPKHRTAQTPENTYHPVQKVSDLRPGKKRCVPWGAEFLIPFKVGPL
jgi:hypothetical protein